jgi:hypothetical protein
MFSSPTIRSGNNAKTVKGDGVYETAIMYLAPYNLAGANVCPMAEQAGCIAGCLNTAGRGQMSNVQRGRIGKTKRYLANRAAFMAELHRDLLRFLNYCRKKGVRPAVRLNGTSDIQWEVAHPVTNPDSGHTFASIFHAFPEIQFYDYTKVYKRVYRDLPVNYRLVLSYSEANPRYRDAVIKAANETGVNLAVVYRHKAFRDDAVMTRNLNRAAWQLVQIGMEPRRVIDGDSDDMRFLDPTGVIVGLYAKGPAKRDTSGFVVG